jgi:capsular polysaccharide biosynthesis protein
MTTAVLLTYLRRYWYLLVVGLLCGLLLAAAWAVVGPKKYEASSLLLLTAPDAESSSGAGDYVESRMPTYAALATSRPVVDGARRSLGLPGTPDLLAEQLTVDVETETLLLRVTATGAAPAAAADLANAVARSYSALAPRLDNPRRPVLRVETVEDAVPPTRPSGFPPPILLLLGAVLGLTLGLLLALKRGAFPRTARNVQDLAQATGAEVLAVVDLASPSVTSTDPLELNDRYAALYSRLDPTRGRGPDEVLPPILVVVSATVDDHAAEVARGLVSTAVSSGQRCLLLVPDGGGTGLVQQRWTPAGDEEPRALRTDAVVHAGKGMLTRSELEAAIASQQPTPDLVLAAAGPVDVDPNARHLLVLSSAAVLTSPLRGIRYGVLKQVAQSVRSCSARLSGVVAVTSGTRSSRRASRGNLAAPAWESAPVGAPAPGLHRTPRR